MNVQAPSTREPAVEPAPAVPRPWWQPASFRELGGLLLSVILVIVLIVVAFRTYAKVGATPVVYTLNDSELTVDPFQQAKDLLNTLFPLFSAVVTFWLGATIEGKRADENKAQADAAKAGQAETEQDKNRVVAGATAALAQVEGMVQGLSLAEPDVPEAFQALGGQPDPRQDILAVLRQAQQSLLE